MTIFRSSTQNLRHAVSKLAADRPWHCYFCHHRWVSERSVRDSLKTIIKKTTFLFLPCFVQYRIYLYNHAVWQPLVQIYFVHFDLISPFWLHK